MRELSQLARKDLEQRLPGAKRAGLETVYALWEQIEGQQEEAARLERQARQAETIGDEQAAHLACKEAAWAEDRASVAFAIFNEIPGRDAFLDWCLRWTGSSTPTADLARQAVQALEATGRVHIRDVEAVPLARAMDLIEAVERANQAPKLEAPANPLPTEGSGQGQQRRKRNEGKMARCRGLYLGYIERKETPPSYAELARMANCDRSTVCRAIKSLEDVRKGFAREDARERYSDHG